jgi:serine/threonine-protein kinase
MDRLPNAAARVVARAMQRYGILLADGGNIALTAQSDRFTRAKWSGLLGSQDLVAMRPSDFEMVDGGERIPLTLDCVRNP